MKYLCMVFLDENVLNNLSPTESQALTDDALDYDEVLRKNGHYLTSSALEPVHAATTVRVRNGKVSVTDGPFAETTEQIGGFILIEARDLNEAIQVAAGIPPARLGGVEVRPLRELTRSTSNKPAKRSPPCAQCAFQRRSRLPQLSRRQVY
jgi:hypothetical protein